MLLIQNITRNALQQQSLTLPDGTNFTLQIYYRSEEQGWFINSISWPAVANPSFVANGLRITAGVNILRQWKNLIPFGLVCEVDGNREPTQIQDFASGVARLYVLTAAEVQEYEAFLAARG